MWRSEWLGHKIGSRLKVSLERFLFGVARWFCFPAALTPIRACDRSRSSNLINAISVEEELGRAQSKPTHTKRVRSRLGTGQHPRSKMFLFRQSVFCFLFPSNN